MRRIIALLLVFSILLVGCSPMNEQEEITTSIETTGIVKVEDVNLPEGDICFYGLNDPELLNYLEQDVYSSIVSELNSEEYFVENVQAVYISKEYLDEVAYNSKDNIYFGYTLAELDECFENTRYVFTLGDDGQTTVEAFEAYDDTYDRVVRNVATGAGVILLCVTVSCVTTVGAPAVSLIFAASAKTGSVIAVSSGVFGGVSAGVIKGLETGDFDEAVKEAALRGSEGFMWGAITGAIGGGAAEYNRLKAFKGIELQIPLKDAAKIQNETGWSAQTIKQIKSVKEYEIYKNARLKEITVNINGSNQKLLLKKDLDLNYKSIFGGEEVTNLERMMKGGAPIEASTGKPYELHHIGQKSEGTLAMLTNAEHHDNASILNTIGKDSEIDRDAFDSIRKNLYKELAKLYSQ